MQIWHWHCHNIIQYYKKNLKKDWNWYENITIVKRDVDISNCQSKMFYVQELPILFAWQIWTTLWSPQTGAESGNYLLHDTHKYNLSLPYRLYSQTLEHEHTHPHTQTCEINTHLNTYYKHAQRPVNTHTDTDTDTHIHTHTHIHKKQAHI